MPRKATTKASTPTDHDHDPAPKRGAKRKSTDHDSTAQNGVGKRAKPSEPAEPEAPEEEEQRPRLTSPDLEFDYDRSQLRDPRATPGRVRRPRLEEREVAKEFRERFFIPQAEVPSKGLSRAAQRDLLFRKQSLLDPTASFYNTYVCHEKGPRGDPTYDSAGFRLDYDKVAEWMKPQYYNKSRIVKGMERSLARGEREEREIFDVFFGEGEGPGADARRMTLDVLHYVKDHISKDLGVPWHQIRPEQAREWQEKGFEKKTFSEWWRAPTEEERRRFGKMLGGGSLRKDL
ncbi:hypothetical protein F4782DRAFT_397866 [Xylaria castorea]|nr:hypothetical protein F4782DRAFT_397866 [Xylaria castorea]